MHQELVRNGLEPLLPREQQVLAGVLSGLSNRQIGEQIHVCEDTVKYHLKRIFLKLGVSRRSAPSRSPCATARSMASTGGRRDRTERRGTGVASELLS